MRYKHQCLEIRLFQIEAEWLNVNVFCVQLHMLGDGSRGAVIEMTLAKVLYMSSECHHLALITVVLSYHKKKTCLTE